MIFRLNVRTRKPKKVVFVDRDGTLIDDDGYLSDPDEIRVIGDAVESLKRLKKEECAVFLVSNQAGVAKGIIPIEKFHRVRRKFESMFDPEGEIFDGIFYCPHHVEGVIPQLRLKCRCRKPETGMVELAVAMLEELPLPGDIYVVGDKYSDVLLGKRMGWKSVLVLTGYGRVEKELIDDPFGYPDIIAKDFDEAVKIIIERD